MPNSDKPRRLKLKADMGSLEMAFEDATGGIEYYLDKETGEVVPIMEDTRRELEQIYEDLDEEGDERKIAFAKALAERDLPEWQKDALLQADLVETSYGERFIRTPLHDSSEGYEDMEEFILTVQDRTLRDLLEVAINGRGAFRRFKDVLARYPEERERWFGFRDDRLRERITEWLESEGIEPVA